MEEFEDTRLVSEYNEAYFQIIRLNNIWLNCKSRRETGNLVGYRWTLDSATIELWGDAVRLDGENSKYTFIKKLEDIEKEISKYLETKDWNKFYCGKCKKHFNTRTFWKNKNKNVTYCLFCSNLSSEIKKEPKTRKKSQHKQNKRNYKQEYANWKARKNSRLSCKNLDMSRHVCGDLCVVSEEAVEEKT
jgi:hypothetical protein